MALFLVPAVLGCGAAAPVSRPDRDVGSFRADADRHARAAREECRPLAVDGWQLDPMLQIHEATTCRYRVTWTGWSPPRDYDYVPDERGFVSDYFISSAHGRVFWNLRTNEAWVRPYSAEHPVDESGARDVAEHAARTNFPGLDLGTLRFDPRPCDPDSACAPP